MGLLGDSNVREGRKDIRCHPGGAGSGVDGRVSDGWRQGIVGWQQPTLGL